jgi:ubiquinone/menaquinone biosynthesis C-methylase UbiE
VSGSELGLSFGRFAREYERGRLEWPPAAVERAAALLGLGADAIVLDLAAGTGKLTRLLVPRFARVFAVEPNDAMRAVLAEVVPDAVARAGTAEAIPLPDTAVDAVFCADAFHWLDGPRALAEIARVLRPGGGLVVVFSEQLGPAAPAIPDAVRNRLLELRAQRKSLRETPDTGLWREAFAGSAFEPLRELAVPFESVADRERMLAAFASQSYVATLPDDEREALFAEIGPLLPAGEHRAPFRAAVSWTRLAS